MTQNDLTERLPGELLIMIFQAWKDLCNKEFQYEYGSVGAEWIRSTWVCKMWRDVALDTAVLWSSVYVSRCLADNPALRTQLDRARGAALNLVVSSSAMSIPQLEEVFDFVSSKTKSIKWLAVMFRDVHQPAVKGFVDDVGSNLVALSLSDLSIHSSNNYHEWEFTPDIFPHLCHLKLDRIVPAAPGAPLLTLTQLEVVDCFDDPQQQPRPTEGHPLTRLHRFLAACPNLENFRIAGSFVSPLLAHEELPTITLRSLQHFSTEGFNDGLNKILGSLRLPTLTSFHIIAEAKGRPEDDLALRIVPRNVSKSLPLIRNTCCLSLMVGQEDPLHLCLRGSSGDTLEDESEAAWSITMPNLTCLFRAPLAFYPAFLDLRLAKLYYLGYNGRRFLAHIPHLVVPSLLVELQLHFAHGLPVKRNWARFFVTMPHLRTLGIGGYTLITGVFEAFYVDPSLCHELQDLALCAAAGQTTEEVCLFSFFQDTVGSWVHERAGAGTGLRSLMVRMPNVTHGGGGGDGDHRGLGGRPDAEPVGFASEVRQKFASLEDFVGTLVFETVDCPACSMEYKLPVDPRGGHVQNNDEDNTYFY